MYFLNREFFFVNFKVEINWFEVFKILNWFVGLRGDDCGVCLGGEFGFRGDFGELGLFGFFG